MSLHPLIGGADTGKWNINSVARDGGHEFGHLLGVKDRDGKYFMNTRASAAAERPTAYDYGWALGRAINLHRFDSRPRVATGRQWETLGAGGGTRGEVRSHKSTQELRPGRFWWR